MLLSEVEPIEDAGTDLLDKNNPDEIISKIVELPLQEACRIFVKKRIQTIMSSANKKNILEPGEKPTEKEDVYGNGQEWLYPRPTFEDAGKGYAWIMLDFDTLSDENKDWLFSLEEREEKAIWFVHPTEIGNLDYKMQTGQYSYEFVKSILDEDEKMPENTKFDERLSKFEKKHIVLSYNNRYPMNTVIIRMPVNKETTIDEVEEYFVKLAQSFKSQNHSKDETNKIKEKDGELIL